MIYCIAEFKAKPGRVDELYNNLKALESDTHKEKGCVQYLVMKRVPNKFATGKSGGIIFNEIWMSEEDFNLHNESKHVQDFFQKNCVDENGACAEFNVVTYER